MQPQIISLIESSDDISLFLTTSDTSMQKQAYLFEQMQLESSEAFYQDELNIWNKSYLNTLHDMKQLYCNNLQNTIPSELTEISFSIVKTRIDLCEILHLPYEGSLELYERGMQHIQDKEYEEGFNDLINAYQLSDALLINHTLPPIIQSNIGDSLKTNSIGIVGLCIGLIFISIGLKRKRNDINSEI